MTSQDVLPASAPARAASRWLGPVLLANLVAEIGIILTGGLVRLTGSGLGCPSWPQCVPGSYTPVEHQAQGFHKYIEFGNRTLTGVLVLLALGALGAVLLWARRRALVVAASVVLGGVFAQAILGGITVRMGLHPATVSAHFLLSAVLVAASAYLWVCRAETDATPRPLLPTGLTRLGRLTAALGGLVVVLGTVVTGSGPHSGDADEPARLGFDPRSVSWLHADAVMLFVGLTVAMVVASRLAGDSPRPARAWTSVLHLSLLQGALGYAQYYFGLPIALVALHMLGSGLLVALLTNAVLAQRSRT